MHRTAEPGVTRADYRATLPNMATAPWKKSNPKGDSPKVKLTDASIAWAKARAKAAGRRYPNLVDNMAATRRQVEAEGSKSGDNRERP